MSFHVWMQYSNHPSKRKQLPLAMSDTPICLTSPIVCDDLSLSFSAYGTGWGYVAIRLPAEVIREKLSGSAAAPEHLLNAFERNRDKIAVAVNRHALPDDGQHIQLDKSDF
ncbi:hypothetical protein KTE65_30450 [Burkholderia multivorans]|uniref:hypothetical protein n=1 Tax=Burkholderia multivorans TaxID=87883 RepID=UPI001905F85D|nr:hypothetical protein [Burkholderia multivorans]MBJ9625984.1 hypothetical protein [Burkholderia multivorans]MBU9354632.1 hypothetical protein [Burkholderia multivorans]